MAAVCEWYKHHCGLVTMTYEGVQGEQVHAGDDAGIYYKAML